MKADSNLKACQAAAQKPNKNQLPHNELSPEELDALLCALVLVPDAYSRNRFFRLYGTPETLRIRRQAVRLRSLIRDLIATTDAPPSASNPRTNPAPPPRPPVNFPIESGPDDTVVTVVLPGLKATRQTVLSPLEAAVVRYGVALANAKPCSEADRIRVERSLRRLYLPPPPPDATKENPGP